MRTKHFITGTVLGFFSIATFGQAPKNCDALKKDNQQLKESINKLKEDTTFLRSKLAYYDKLNSNVDFTLNSFNSQFTIKILSCTGDRSSQTVKIEFVIHHKKPNQDVTFNGMTTGNINAYDEIGNTFYAKDLGLANSTGSYNYAHAIIPTDIDVKGYAIFSGIIGGTDKLKLVNIFVEAKNADGGANPVSGKIEIKNLKIQWR